MITKVTKVSLLRINMCDISPHILSVQHHIYLDICAQSGNKNCPHSFYFRRTLSVPIWQMFVLKKCWRSLMIVFFCFDDDNAPCRKLFPSKPSQTKEVWSSTRLLSCHNFLTPHIFYTIQCVIILDFWT